MKRSIKIALIAIFILIILFIGICFLYSSIKPSLLKSEYLQPIWVTVYGNITSLKGSDRSSYVEIYSPYQFSEYLYRAEQLAITKINWINDTNNGYYSVSFELPIPMEVYITSDSLGCNHKLVSFTNVNIKEVDLIDENKCSDSIAISDNKDDIIRYSDILLSSLKSEISNKKYNDTENQEISGYIYNGYQSITDSKVSRDINESLLYAYESEWFVWKTKYTVEVFDLKYCVLKIKNLLDTYNNSLCYVPDYSSNKSFSNANSTYFSIVSGHSRNYPPQSIEEIKKEINEFYNDRQSLSEIFWDCQESYSMINKTFEFQKTYCDEKKDILSIFKISWLILAAMLSFLVGIFLGLRYKKNIDSTSKSFGKYINKLINAISEDRIKVIVATSATLSSVTVILFLILQNLSSVYDKYNLSISLWFTSYLIKSAVIVNCLFILSIITGIVSLIYKKSKASRLTSFLSFFLACISFFIYLIFVVQVKLI